MRTDIPRLAEKTQGISLTLPFRVFRDLGYSRRIKPLSSRPMDYKKEIGRRIRVLRRKKGWTLEELSARTADVLSLQRIAAYETGERMPKPADIVVLARALQTRPAYLMAMDENETRMSPIEERFLKNWGTLPENERMEIYRDVDVRAMRYRDAVQDAIVERHLPKVVAAKKRKIRREA